MVKGREDDGRSIIVFIDDLQTIGEQVIELARLTVELVLIDIARQVVQQSVGGLLVDGICCG